MAGHDGLLNDVSIRFIGKSDPSDPLWWRYIDDIFTIWQHGEEKLKEFLKYLIALIQQ